MHRNKIFFLLESGQRGKMEVLIRKYNSSDAVKQSKTKERQSMS